MPRDGAAIFWKNTEMNVWYWEHFLKHVRGSFRTLGDSEHEMVTLLFGPSRIWNSKFRSIRKGKLLDLGNTCFEDWKSADACL